MIKADPLDSIPEHHWPQVGCTDCPFGGPQCGSKGNPEADIVFVGESPGWQEIKQKAPLVGPSGNVFHQNIPKDMEDNIYVLNAMECFPKKHLKDDPHMTYAIGCCHARLMAKITSHPRKIIVAMGNWAMRSLTGDTSLKIMAARGALIESPLAEIGIMPVIHMAALMRGTGSYKQFQEDIAYAIDLAKGKPLKSYIESEPYVVPLDSSYQDIKFFLRGSTSTTADWETSSLNARQGYVLQLGITRDDDPSITWCFL